MSIPSTGPLALHGAIQPLYCGACQMRRYNGHVIKCPYHKKMTNKQASKRANSEHRKPAEQQVVAKNIYVKRCFHVPSATVVRHRSWQLFDTPQLFSWCPASHARLQHHVQTCKLSPCGSCHGPWTVEPW